MKASVSEKTPLCDPPARGFEGHSAGFVFGCSQLSNIGLPPNSEFLNPIKAKYKLDSNFETTQDGHVEPSTAGIMRL